MTNLLQSSCIMLNKILSLSSMAILTFEQKHDFWKRPFNLSTHNLLCIEYGHLDLSRHDLGKALLFFPSKIYSALYVHPDFRTNFNISTCT